MNATIRREALGNSGYSVGIAVNTIQGACVKARQDLGRVSPASGCAVCVYPAGTDVKAVYRLFKKNSDVRKFHSLSRTPVEL
jgi:hypothetical protein